MPGGNKKGGGLEVESAYKMKYQGNPSAFPFKSPLKQWGMGATASVMGIENQNTRRYQNWNMPGNHPSRRRRGINPNMAGVASDIQ